VDKVFHHISKKKRRRNPPPPFPPFPGPSKVIAPSGRETGGGGECTVYRNVRIHYGLMIYSLLSHIKKSQSPGPSSHFYLRTRHNSMGHIIVSMPLSQAHSLRSKRSFPPSLLSSVTAHSPNTIPWITRPSAIPARRR
jgi:hypothetical protein